MMATAQPKAEMAQPKRNTLKVAIGVTVGAIALAMAAAAPHLLKAQTKPVATEARK